MIGMVDEMVDEVVGGEALVAEVAVSVEEMVDGAVASVEETVDVMEEETVNLVDENREEEETTHLDRVGAKSRVERASSVVNQAMPSMH